MKYNRQFNRQPALRFRQFTRKPWALFACLGRVVTISVLSVATLESASAATDDITTKVERADEGEPDKEMTLDDLEVTGSLAPLATGQASRMVTVLSRDDIQAAAVQSVNDLLKLAVGVDVRQRGPIGAQTDIGIRGGTQEQITILLNGINICDPQTGHNAFDLPCDVSDILRIEVIEGAAGRVYGTSSMAGAINIVTAGAKYPTNGSTGNGSLQARAEGGSFGYANLAASVVCHSTLTSRFSTSLTRSDGYSRSTDGCLNSDYEGAKAYYQGELSDAGSKLLWYAGLSTRGYGSNTFYSAKYDEQYEHTTKWFAALQGETLAGRLHLKPSVYWNRGFDRFELIRGSESKVPFNHHRTDVFGIHINSWFDWFLGRTAVGAEFRNEDIVSGNLGEPLNNPHGDYRYGINRSNLSLHAEHNVLLKRFTLSAGLIAVKNTWAEMPFTLYPGADASLRLSEQWKLYGSYNSSLRMPSFTELYYGVGGHKADKYLKPEKLQALECGIKFCTRTVTAQASLFHHHATNLIDWVMDTREAEPVWQSVNLTTVNTLGEELAVSFTPKPVSGAAAFGESNTGFSLKKPLLSIKKVDIAYCHLHQDKDLESHLQSQYSLEYLRHKLMVNVLTRLFSALDLTLSYRFQDRMGTYTDTGGQTRHYHPYSTLDARIAWSSERVTLFAEANNLTDHPYVDYGNVPQPGLWLTFGAKYRIDF